MDIIFLIAVLLVSFYLLAVICEEFFVPTLDIISDRLKLSSDVAGATFMAIGSSAPELFTSLFAIIKPGDHANVGAGTIVGSAIFNILVIIGISASFKAAKLTWQPVLRDLIFYSASIIALMFVFWDGRVDWFEAIVFIGLYLFYILAVVKWKSIFPYKDVDPIDIIEESNKKNRVARASKKFFELFIPDPEKKPNLYLVSFSLTIVFIALLSFILVESAVELGNILMINPTIIALTVLAAGTSIPDLLSSVIVAKQGRGDMAISNAVGSNIFDILFGLGLPWLLVLIFKGESIAVENENLIGSVVLLFATVLAIFTILILRKWTISKRAGLLLVFAYLIYLAYNVLSII